jgi:hypothetical protein
MSSIYTRLFSYRQNEKLSPTETFLTEILGYCLEHDKLFLVNFTRLIGLDGCEESLIIKTQSSYSTIGRPDIELYSQNYRIIIECKVDASERENQLSDYSLLLSESKKKNLRLVYLTKYLESKESTLAPNQFVQICWYDVAKIINSDNHYFTIQFKIHLKELNMANIKFFSTLDLAALKTMSATIEKMDDTLDALRPYYTQNFGSLSKKSARSTRLKDGWYINWQSFYQEKKMSFDITYGYYWFFEGDEIPCIGLRIWIPTYGMHFKSNPIYKIFSKELKNWISENPIEERDNGIVIARYSYLSDFMTSSNNEDQLKEIIDFLKNECINPIIRIKEKHSELFSGQKTQEDVDKED